MLTKFRARMQGKTGIASPSRRKVADLLRQQEQQTAKRERNYAAGAARLDSLLEFQPGLVHLHDDLLDIVAYLQTLGAHAHSSGHRRLADALGYATATITRATDQVATAATETATQP